MSADGYIADADGGVGFLDAFSGDDHGYEQFWSGIDAVIMGRASFDQVLSFDVGWPYAGRTAHVVTSSPLPATAPDGVERWTGTLPEYAKSMARHTAWVVGGARLQASFIAGGLLDRLELFVIPVLLGKGIPLFDHDGPPVSLQLADSTTYPDGVLRLDYRLGG